MKSTGPVFLLLCFLQHRTQESTEDGADLLSVHGADADPWDGRVNKTHHQLRVVYFSYPLLFFGSVVQTVGVWFEKTLANYLLLSFVLCTTLRPACGQTLTL